MRFLSGGEEGQSVLYHEDQFPSGAISPVTFMWRPLKADSRSIGAGADGSSKFELHADWQESKRQLWLWIHPAAFLEAASAIASACQSILEDSEDEYVWFYCMSTLTRNTRYGRWQLMGCFCVDACVGSKLSTVEGCFVASSSVVRSLTTSWIKFVGTRNNKHSSKLVMLL